MATKNNPGKFDCYDNAHPDEPMFVLLGRDPLAPFLVDLWIKVRRELGSGEPEQLAEAETCVRSLHDWCLNLGKGDKLDAARTKLGDVLMRLAREAVEG